MRKMAASERGKQTAKIVAFGFVAVAAAAATFPCYSRWQAAAEELGRIENGIPIASLHIPGEAADRAASRFVVLKEATERAGLRMGFMGILTIICAGASVLSAYVAATCYGRTRNERGRRDRQTPGDSRGGPKARPVFTRKSPLPSAKSYCSAVACLARGV